MWNYQKLMQYPLNITKKDLKPSKSYIKESLSIGIPNTTGRLVGSIGYFFEPILLTGVLIHMGYSSSFITREYGVLSGYVMPILLLPSFFTMAISNALLPIVSKDYSNKRYDNVKKKIMLAALISLIIGGVGGWVLAGCVGNPFDTTDHNQDGYGVYGAERFIYNFTFYDFFGDAPDHARDKCFVAVSPVQK